MNLNWSIKIELDLTEIMNNFPRCFDTFDFKKPTWILIKLHGN